MPVAVCLSDLCMTCMSRRCLLQSLMSHPSVRVGAKAAANIARGPGSVPRVRCQAACQVPHVSLRRLSSAQSAARGIGHLSATARPPPNTSSRLVLHGSRHAVDVEVAQEIYIFFLKWIVTSVR